MNSPEDLQALAEIVVKCRTKAVQESNPNWRRCWSTIADLTEEKLTALRSRKEQSR